ncbi:MAG: hypothetical protein FJ302_14810 [Planctomycetes bacterium]|nr:hypothetical protein [Planctomycetota bacterium]
MAFLDAKSLRRWSGAALLIYLTALVAGTHLPHPEDLISIEGNDKWLHFGAYFGLAFLMATWWQSFRAVTQRGLLTIWSLAGITGVVDELTQMLPGINRHCELADWLADVVGAACGLLIWIGLRRVFDRRDFR